MKYFIILFIFLAGCANQSVLVGIGGVYVPRVPEQQLTGNGQFHISVEHSVKINNNFEIKTSWHHYSNGAQLGIGEQPNYGFDALGSQLVLKVW